MVDFVSPEKRGNIMRGSRSKDTKPELLVRRLLHSMGYRFRLHLKDLPGKPDIALRSRKKAIFVHGCFWHQHEDPSCRVARKPVSNTGYWNSKFSANADRDARNLKLLKDAGWEVLIMWECDYEPARLRARLSNFLGPTSLRAGRSKGRSGERTILGPH